MATRSFVDSTKLQQAKEILLGSADFAQSSKACSSFLIAELEKALPPSWSELRPVILGSWARGELCPRSDLDVIFLADEKKVQAFTHEIMKTGVRLRFRSPLDANDWTQGVEPADCLALLDARAWNIDDQPRVDEQRHRILRDSRLKRALAKFIRKEREARSGRLDSMTQFLEPNLKLGAGALRDILQGEKLLDLFSEKMGEASHVREVFSQYRELFLFARLWLHLEGEGDVLSASNQIAIAKHLKYKTLQDYMREVHRGMTRIDFYHEWLLARQRTSLVSLAKIDQIKYSSLTAMTQQLQDLRKTDTAILTQRQVRAQLGKVKDLSIEPALMRKLVSPKSDPSWMVAVFRSRLIDRLVPEFERLSGWVQHDQYHRYTADTHLMRALVRTKVVYRKTKLLGPLKTFADRLSEGDWEILAWTALYHDIAKGLGGDHSNLGVKLARKDFVRFELPEKLQTEVFWMIENHLDISTAAFRKNFRQPDVWEDLRAKGFDSIRVQRMAVFTAIDIWATNPEAWNSWKAQLLTELCEVLLNPATTRYLDFLKMAEESEIQGLEVIDAGLLKHLSPKVLLADIKSCKASSEKFKFRLWSVKRGEYLLRLYASVDKKGLFVDWVGRIFQTGASIRHAYVQTLPGIGAYDFFLIKSSRTKKILQKQLELSNELRIPEVKFSEIELVGESKREWSVSFRGYDQSGFLLRASQMLFALNANLQWAKVHTWGDQVDDVFGVKPVGGYDSAESFVQKLREI